MDRDNKNLSDYFNVCINIIEAKDLPDSNISSLVCIQVGEQKKHTSVIKHTNQPYFDEYFVFEIFSNFEKAMTTVVTISLFKSRKKLKGKKLIGCIMFDVGFIWSQPNQRFQNWVSVTVPSDPSAQVTGLLRCAVRIEGPATYSKLPELEGTGILDSIALKRARYRIKVYKCVGLKCKSKENAPDVYVRVLFAGATGYTTKRTLRETVEWNEQITFITRFPPLFHKLTIDLVVGKDIVSKHFYILEQLKYLKGGYRNIFGPNYVHLYKSEFAYSGSLFMTIEADRSVFKTSEKLKRVITMPTEKPSKQMFGNFENFLCFGLLFDSMLNGRRWGGSDIQLTLNFGYSRQKSEDEPKDRLSTELIKALPGNSNFSYLPLNEQKPCVFVRSEWPDCTHRLQNSNMISNTSQNLRSTIKLARKLIATGNTIEAKNAIISSVTEFKKNCQEASQLLVRGANDLDSGRVQFLSKFLLLNLPDLASSCIEESRLELVIEKLMSLLNVVDNLCEDVQDSLPCIILSLKSEKTVIGSSKIHPRQILFSKKSRKRGSDCGKIVSVLIKSSNNNHAGRIDIWLWLGFWDEVAHCINELPPGHEDLSKIVSLPPYLTYNKFERYVIYCRIYSGYIVDILSCDGPCDTFVRVLCSNQSQQTKVEKKSLAPIWMETLVLSDIRLYPSITFNQNNPPLLTVELWKQAKDSTNLIGVELVRPSFIAHVQAEKEFKLQWLKIEKKARILSAFEIVQIRSDPDDPFNLKELSTINPKVLDPVTVPFRLEIVFWGIRPVDIRGLNKRITRVQAIIQCSRSELKSNIITRTMNSLNFQHDLHTLPLQLPRVNLFSPPLILQIISDNIYVGCAFERNVRRYEYKLPTKMEWAALHLQNRALIEQVESRHSFSNQESMPDLIPLMEIEAKRRSSSGEYLVCNCILNLKKLLYRISSFFSGTINKVDESIANIQPAIEAEEYDWWFDYFSGEVKVYKDELENQNEFNGFNDILETYYIKERNKGGLKDIMKVKIIVCLYEWPSEKKLRTFEGQDPEMGVLLRLTEIRDRVKLLVRVYCVRAYNLNPSDPNGLADPFIEIATASNCISDKNNYIPKQLNPVFGTCLEIPAMLPTDSILTVRVKDWDLFTASDLIGETDIDIENRFYSKHRATCGLPKTYTQNGYNSWRDVEKPTEILEKLCNTYNLPLPQYYEFTVLVGSKAFIMHNPQKNRDKKIKPIKNIYNTIDNKERLALLVLNKWSVVPIVGRPLVPQHVETRSLFVKDRPGIERGKLELWVDLFDQSSGEIPPPVDIKPREPQMYELRVIIQNTAKVPLVDSSIFVGKKHTDIFVKGWLWDPNDSQSTDIHYTSINGTGNFNWRFIFQFLYLRQEKRMVIYKNDFFSIGISETKVPALLHLQVWDSDRLSPDDFIGAMVLELCNMPRGSISLKTCKPKQFISPSQTFDLFKVKHMRGWWPFFQMTTDIEPKHAGFLEAEFHLLNKEEAIINPAGLGRAAPNALPPPFRPSIKIKFWLAPFRALGYVCKANKYTILMGCSIVGAVIFIVVAIYSIPVFIVKRLLQA